MDHLQGLLDRSGIHCFRIPNPFSTIETNCYFIDDSTPTLIDTGIATEEAYQKLNLELARVGRRPADIEKIILTHGHADHRALAPRIQEETGAEVLYHHAERAKVMVTERHSSTREAGRRFFRSHGVPEELVPGLVDGPQSPFIKPKSTAATPLEGGEQISLGNLKLKAIHTPGHSSGSMCLVEEEQGLLFTGDTLLPTSRITALIELELLERDPGYNPLMRHLESLRRIEALRPRFVLPGHGDPFRDYQAVNEEVRVRHRKRRTHILRALRNEAKTLYQVCRSVFPFNSPDDLYLALSEVAGNVGILLDEGAVIMQDHGQAVLYEKT